MSRNLSPNTASHPPPASFAASMIIPDAAVSATATTVHTAADGTTTTATTVMTIPTTARTSSTPMVSIC